MMWMDPGAFFLRMQAPTAAVLLTVRRFWEKLFEFFTPQCGNYRHFSVDNTMVGICLFGIFAGVLAVVFVSSYIRSLHADFVGTLMDLGANSKETAVTLPELGFEKSRRVKKEFREHLAVARYVRCVEEERFATGTVADRVSDGGVPTDSADADIAKSGAAPDRIPDGEVPADSADADIAKSGAVPDCVPEGEVPADSACVNAAEPCTAPDSMSEEASAADAPAGAEPRGESDRKSNSGRESQAHSYVYDFETAHFYLPEENRIGAEVRFAPGKQRTAALIAIAFGVIAVYFLSVWLIPDLLQLFDNCLGMMLR